MKRQPKPAQPAKPAEPAKRKPLKIDPTLIGRIKGAIDPRNEIDLSEIFKAAPSPKGFTVTKEQQLATDSAKLAMDDAITQLAPQINAIGNWGGMFGSAYQEGLVWPGFAILSIWSIIPEFRRMSEIVAKEMTRKWIKLESVGETDNTQKLQDIEADFKKFGVQLKFEKCAGLDGFFGRGHLYIDLGTSNNPAELLTPIASPSGEIIRAKIKKGSLKALRVIEPIWTYPNAYNASDPLAPDYYKPQSWFVQGKQLDASRLLTFIGREVSDMLKPAYSFGGLSLSQMAKPYVDNWLRTRQSVSDIIHAFSVFVLKTNMQSVLQGGDGGSGFGLDDGSVITRAQLFNQFRDNLGLMMLDKDSEEFENVAAPLSGLDHLQAQAQEHLAAVSGIPLVKLLGITPSGLNASSDGEMRCWYDWVEAQQESMFRTNLSIILNLIQLNLYGEIDPNIGFRFEPLWSLDAATISTMRKTDMEHDAIAIDAGVINPQESRTRLAAEEGSPFAALDLTEEIIPPDTGTDPDMSDLLGNDPTPSDPTEEDSRAPSKVPDSKVGKAV